MFLNAVTLKDDFIFKKQQQPLKTGWSLRFVERGESLAEDPYRYPVIFTTSICFFCVATNFYFQVFCNKELTNISS